MRRREVPLDFYVYPPCILDITPLAFDVQGINDCHSHAIPPLLFGEKGKAAATGLFLALLGGKEGEDLSAVPLV